MCGEQRLTENALNMLEKYEPVIMPTPKIIEKIEHKKRKKLPLSFT